MVEIKVNDEIKNVSADVGKGLSMGQWLWIIIGVAVGAAIGFLLYYTTPLPLIVVGYIAAIIAVPFGAMSFFTWHEMSPLAAVRLAVVRFLDPGVKTYSHENMEYILWQKQLSKRDKKKNRKEKDNE